MIGSPLSEFGESESSGSGLCLRKATYNVKIKFGRPFINMVSWPPPSSHGLPTEGAGFVLILWSNHSDGSEFASGLL